MTTPSTQNNGTIDFGAIMAQAAEKLTSVEAVTPIVEKHLKAAIEEAIKDQFGYFGDMSKVIKEAVKNSMHVNLDLGLPAYNDMVAKLVKKEIEHAILHDGFEYLQAGIQTIFNLPPKEIRLTEIVEHYATHCAMHKDEWDSGEFYCEIENENDGWYTLLLHYDKDAKYRKEFKIRVTRDGQIFGLDIDDVDVVKSEITKRYYEDFKKLVFNLYASQSKIINDEEDLPVHFTWGYEPD